MQTQTVVAAGVYLLEVFKDGHVVPLKVQADTTNTLEEMLEHGEREGVVLSIDNLTLKTRVYQSAANESDLMDVGDLYA